MIVYTHSGKPFQISAEDYDLVDGVNWCIWEKNGIPYIARQVYIEGKQKRVFLHHLILERIHGLRNTWPKGLVCDHIDGDGTNSNRENLRRCTNAENHRNAKLYARNTSGYKGVSYDTRLGKWVADISVDGQRIYLGSFNTPEAVAQAYDIAAINYHGEFARTNKDLGLYK